jgi:hypothetical protein
MALQSPRSDSHCALNTLYSAVSLSVSLCGRACDEEDFDESNVDGVEVNHGGTKISPATQQRTISAFFARKPAVTGSETHGPGAGMLLPCRFGRVKSVDKSRYHDRRIRMIDS